MRTRPTIRTSIVLLGLLSAMPVAHMTAADARTDAETWIRLAVPGAQPAVMPLCTYVSTTAGTGWFADQTFEFTLDTRTDATMAGNAINVKYTVELFQSIPDDPLNTATRLDGPYTVERRGNSGAADYRNNDLKLSATYDDWELQGEHAFMIRVTYEVLPGPGVARNIGYCYYYA
jgi:hypothetical protein